ncbi:MAG: aldehyde ferredoxin oxidoreductase family protein [Deltaproteobacteria bacterium]|nr:aldehyde ferredoxin oxidoreductase family protein [Deltaproteobacteria bacterium]
MKGYMNRIVEVNLTKRTTEVVQLDDEIRKKFIGGSGLGAKILWDSEAYRFDPLSEDNTLIFMTGPFASTPALLMGRHAVVSRSPLTGIFGEADSGGTWGPTLKRAGYDGIVVRGKADRPVYLWVSEEGVEIRDAGHLWGKDTFDTDAALRAETAEKAVTACIGQAGERLVRMAAVMNDGRAARAAGRCGLGAVMGFKKLKAITAYGSQKTPIHDREGLLKAVKEIARTIRENMVGMTKYGTSGGLASFEELGSLPLQNWKRSERWKDGASEITGAAMAERIGAGNYGCEGCVVRCGREIQVTDGPYAGLEGAGPEYETLSSLGSLCLIDDLNAIAMANELCNRYGIDTISVGAMVAFAMEAYEQGILTNKDTDGMELTWGNARAMIETVRMIGENRGLGSILARGCREAAKELGPGADQFAVHAKGLEFPMHDPRCYMAGALQYATSARGACHLSGMSHAFERVLTSPEIGLGEVPDRLATEGKGILTAKTQNIMGMYDSLKVCKFIQFGGLTITHLVDWYEKITGESMSIEKFMLTGERIFNLKRLFNLKCGITQEDDTVSARILNLPKEAEGWKTRRPPVSEMMKDYYAFRGWDDKGVPTDEKLKTLGLAE